MSHAITQVIDLIVAELKGNTNCGDNVFFDHPNPFEAETIPYLEVTYLSDTNSEKGVLGQVWRDVEIEFRIVTKENGIDSRAAFDIRAQIETIFDGCSVTMDSKAYLHVMNDAELEADSESENTSFQHSLNYQFLVKWEYGKPEILI